MKIILIRHGQAEGFKDQDSSRQLTKFGHQQAQETAEYIMQKYSPDLLVVSPYDRARQTLQAFQKHAPKTPTKTLATITPNGNINRALEDLSQLADDNMECILVVCHMPIVANMVGALLGEWATAYSLAEARILQCEVLAENLAEQIDGFIPTQAS
ncbi:MAG: phosphohistidine phosphatase SixA [Moraxellaceae bacterium]|nr:phosphohistidine phosphatase SixA [Moraxellaceae bacterium]